MSSFGRAPIYTAYEDMSLRSSEHLLRFRLLSAQRYGHGLKIMPGLRFAELLFIRWVYRIHVLRLGGASCVFFICSRMGVSV